MISMTSRVFNDETVIKANLSVNATAQESADNRNTKLYEAVSFIYSQLPALSEAGFMGHFNILRIGDSQNIYEPFEVRVNDTTNLWFMGSFQAFSVFEADVRAALQPILDYVARAGTASLVADLRITGGDAARLALAPSSRETPVETDFIITMRLLDKEGVTHPRMPEVLWRMANAVGRAGDLMITRPRIRSIPADSTAAHPAWQKTYVSLSQRQTSIHCTLEDLD